MEPSSRTPEGSPNRCWLCGHEVRLEPSCPPGDAPCPHCGCLLWFDLNASESSEVAGIKSHWAIFLAQKIRAGDLDVALERFRQLVQTSPGEFRYREALRKTQYRKYNNSGRGATLAFVRSCASRNQLRRARRQKNWDIVDRAAEECLALNPWDVEANMELANACRQRGYHDVATYAYRCAYMSLPAEDNRRNTIKEIVKEMGES